MSLPGKHRRLIVGAGPVGVTLGNLLGRYGVSALIIDKASGILAHPRAIADNEALRILQMAGLGKTLALGRDPRSQNALAILRRICSF